jgi:hypothetical protein
MAGPLFDDIDERTPACAESRFGIVGGDFPELTTEEAKAITMKPLAEPQ